MSHLIKHNISGGLEEIGTYKGRNATSLAALPKADFLVDLLTPDQRSLEIANAYAEDLHDQINQMKAQFEGELEVAYQNGKSDAKATFVRSERLATEALTTSIQDALVLYQLKLEQFNKTALLAAEVVLEHLLSDSTIIRTIVAHKIAELIAKYDDKMVTAISVSSADFADPESFMTISKLNLDRRASVTISNSLSQGAFEVELQLGHLEFALVNSLAEVKTFFHDVLLQSDVRK